MPPELSRRLESFDAELGAALAKARTVNHGGRQGGQAEAAWLEFLNRRMPARYAVASGEVFDSVGGVSEDQDVIVYDPQYSSLVFGDDDPRVPAEAVYAVIEVKPKLTKQHFQYAENKAASVRARERTSVPIYHAGGVYPEKALTRQLAGLVADQSGWSDATTIDKAIELLDHRELEDPRALNLVYAEGCAFSNLVNPMTEQREVRHHTGPGSLAWFLLELLRGLSHVGTVAAIDYSAYRAAIESG